MIRFQTKGRCTGPRGVGFAAALMLAATLTGCGPADTALPRDTARQLQELVLAVSQAAAANDHSAALRTLDSLEADVRTAAGSGRVSEERRRSIMTSITAVRADLTAAIDAAAAAKAAEEAAAAAAAAEAEKAKSDAEAAAGAAQEYTAPVFPAPVPAPLPAPEKGTGNEGNANEGRGNEGRGKNRDS
jgi:hypothetical protein